MASDRKTIRCPRCGTALELPDSVASGSVIQCGACQRNVRIRRRRKPSQQRPVVLSPPDSDSDSGEFDAEDASPGHGAGGLWLTLASVAVILGCAWWILNSSSDDTAPSDTASNTEASDKTIVAGTNDELASQVQAIFESRCHDCHGAAGTSEGGFNFIVSLDKLAEDDTYITPGDPGGSYLFERITSNEMPPEGEGTALTTSEVDVIRQWIAAGAPTVTPIAERIFITNDEMFRTIRTHLLRNTEEDDREYARFFTITHLYNAGLSDDELETYRLALAKLLNSLSWNRNLLTLEPIDEAETIFCVDLRDLQWSESVWQKILERDPYSIEHTSSAAQLCSKETGCRVPVVRGDWFVAKAARPPMYHDVLQIPATLDALASQLRVDIDRNIAQGNVMRAGFIESGISGHNRIIERHETSYGPMWVSYDFGSSTGRKNILSHPMGPGTGSGSFEHDGGEIIFTLPNGLQGYMLVDANGNRLDKGPLDIVADDRQADRHVVNGISCMACHFGGIIRKGDEVRANVTASRAAFARADEILRIYPESSLLTAKQDQDAAAFQAVLREIGISRITATNEPVLAMAERFDESVDLQLAAAELGVGPDELIDVINASPVELRALGVLKLPNGRLKRQQFLEQFVSAAEALGIGKRLDSASGSSTLAQAPSPSPLPPAAGRPWKTEDGTLLATGDFVSFDDGKTVVIRGAGGKTVNIAIDQLGKDDIAFVLSKGTQAASNQPDNPKDLPAEVLTEVVPAEPEPPPFQDFHRLWTDSTGNPMIYARFDELTLSGRVRLSVLPRKWQLRKGQPKAFTGTFWTFFSVPGRPGVMVTIGDLRVPGLQARHIDIPLDNFSQLDQDYLMQLDALKTHGILDRGKRLRFFSIPLDTFSDVDRDYIDGLIRKGQKGGPRPPVNPPAGQPPAGQPPAGARPGQGVPPGLPPGLKGNPPPGQPGAGPNQPGAPPNSGTTPPGNLPAAPPPNGGTPQGSPAPAPN
ncbi:c-type cytochrome domain-containing protein [Maioricimonas sp. JC845]|uniref:c-type cytochrome domain-containing protein n=1 Tax=Maioricimonas sp. JC845 TaxID=3232138 RepID=UPI003458EB6E